MKRRSTSRRRPTRKTRALCAAASAALTLLLSAAPALAGTVSNERPLLFGFDGKGTTAGAFTNSNSVAVDRSSGYVYVLNLAGEGKGPGPYDAQRVIDKFNSKGEAQDFTAGMDAGKSSLNCWEHPPGTKVCFGFEGSFGNGSYLAGLAVDNSGGLGGPGEGEQGRIYVSEEAGPIHAFAPTGAYLWTLPRATAQPCGIAVDREGHLWVGNGYGEGEAQHKVLEFAASGSPPAQIGEFTVTSGNTTACALAMDESGANFYLNSEATRLDKYVGGAFDSTRATSGSTFAIGVDQSVPAGHIFTLDATGFEELEPCGAGCFGNEVPGSPFGGDLIGSGRGIAYDPAGDRVYVSDVATNTVKVFGPAASGPVPDVRSEATDGISQTEAAAHGTIDPRGLANSYHFEWIEGEAQRVGVEATGGSFKLTATAAKGHGNLSAGSKVVAEATAASGAFHVGDSISTSSGSEIPNGIGNGNLVEGSTTVSEIDPYTPGGGSGGCNENFAVGQTLSGPGIPEGTTIAALSCGIFKSDSKLTLSAPATETRSGAVFTARTTIAAIGAGTLTLSSAAGMSEVAAPFTTHQTTAPIAWDAPAAASEGAGSVEAALAALPAVGAANVSVGGTPAGGSAPLGRYDVVFRGSFAGRNVNQLETDGRNASHLTGEQHTVSVSTITQGQTWGSAESGPPAPYPSIEPTDSAEHAVSLALTGLQRDTTYDVRLVGTDTEVKSGAGKATILNAYASPADTFTTEPPEPAEVKSCSTSEITTESAEVKCTIDPKHAATSWSVFLAALPHAGQAECEAAPASAFHKAKEGEIPDGEPGTVEVTAKLKGLQVAQTYCVRAFAENAGGGTPPFTAVFTTVAIEPSDVETAFAAPRSDTSARLNGYVDPNGSPLAYRFEYSADGGHTWLPVEGCRDASGEATARCEDRSGAREQILVAEEMSGLSPATAYRYRFSAENAVSAAPSTGAEKGFATRSHAEVAEAMPSACPENEEVRASQRFSPLPRCRGVELVNQPDKGNQDVNAGAVSASGGEAVWSVNAGVPGSPYGAGGSFLARRDGDPAGDGWASRGILPPPGLFPEVHGYGVRSVPTDFSHFLVSTGAFPGYIPPWLGFLRCDALQSCQTLVRYPVTGHNKGINRIDVTPDLAHVLFINRQSQQLVDVGGGEEQVVGLLPNGAPPPCGINDEEPNFFFQGGYHWIAATDASRVYFKAYPGEECEGLPPTSLYERNREAGKTTLIAASTVPGGEDVSFVRATPDGRGAYFVWPGNCRKYTESGAACEKEEAADANGHPDVYRWDEASGESTCLTCALQNEAGEAIDDADVRGGASVMVSDDFSHVYFESSSKLSPQATAGKVNLYALSGGRVRFVATSGVGVGGSGGALRGIGLSPAQLTGDGNVLVFTSKESLTADSLARCRGCAELYRYEDSTGSLECLSCLRGGVTSQPVGGEAQGHFFDISGDGRSVALVTAQALLPADVNARPDVYEWRNGVLHLITDGVTQFKSQGASPRLVAIDPSGRDIFFTVAQPGLTGFEEDGLASLYDARVGGGFPPPVAPVECDVLSDKCQGPVQPAPSLALPNSFSFNGPSNEAPSRPAAKPKPKPKRCGRGRVRGRVHGKVRCVGRGHKRAAHARRGRRR